jgi:hypothetical protein
MLFNFHENIAHLGAEEATTAGQILELDSKQLMASFLDDMSTLDATSRAV